MQELAGTFNGQGAAVYLCIGFLPDYVEVRALEDGLAHMQWDITYRAAAENNGVLYQAEDVQLGSHSAGTGIEPFEGGVQMTTAIQTSTANNRGVYLKRDAKDYKAKDVIEGSPAIDTWTLDDSGAREGHFNNDVVGTYIGEGSRICIDGRWYIIEAVTAGEGADDNEVTLSRAAGSGVVQGIMNMFDYTPIAIGDIAPAGFKLNKYTEVNVQDKLQSFKAGVRE